MAEYDWTPKSGDTYRWEISYGKMIPPDAVQAGVDADDELLFVGRIQYEDNLLPAKVAPAHACAFASYDGEEIIKHTYEVLCSAYVAWKHVPRGDMPAQAVKIGYTQSGDGGALYMGRAILEGTLTPGKIQAGDDQICIPWGGGEVKLSTYEVMVSDYDLN